MYPPPYITAVTVAQVKKSKRVHNTAPFKFGEAGGKQLQLDKVTLVGNVFQPRLNESGTLMFNLMDGTDSILVLCSVDRCSMLPPLDSLLHSPPIYVRVTGQPHRPKGAPPNSSPTMIKADNCMLVNDVYEPFHHCLQVMVEFVRMCREPEPELGAVANRLFPSPMSDSESEEDNEDRDDRASDAADDHQSPAPPNVSDDYNVEMGQNNSEFHALTSSLANTSLAPADDQDVFEMDTDHSYPPQSPHHRASTSPPCVTYYPKANGDLDNTFVFLDTEGAPKPLTSEQEPSPHAYPPYPPGADVPASPLLQPVDGPIPVRVPLDALDFAENGDIDDSFVFLDSDQPPRANGAPYLPSRRSRLSISPPARSLLSISPPKLLSISPPTRNLFRRSSPPQRESPSKKARLDRDPYSKLSTLERNIILFLTTTTPQSRRRSLYNYEEQHNIDDGVHKSTIAQAMTKQNSSITMTEINKALKVLVDEARLCTPVDPDRFVIV